MQAPSIGCSGTLIALTPAIPRSQRKTCPTCIFYLRNGKCPLTIVVKMWCGFSSMHTSHVGVFFSAQQQHKDSGSKIAMAGIAQVVGMIHLPHLRPFFALQADELHQYLEELPALDQCLAARELQAQIRACRNTWPEYWFLPALARFIDSHLDILYEIPLWPYQEPAESFWDSSFSEVGDRLQQEVSELISRFEMTCEFIAWNELGVHLSPWSLILIQATSPALRE